jgi:hypothetical protein
MALLKKKLIGTDINSTTPASGSHDFNGVTPKRITLLVQLVETGVAAHTRVTLTVEVSANLGVDLIAYDKLIDDAGVDAPVSEQQYDSGSDYDDVLSLSLEDVVDYIKVTVTPVGTPTATKYITTDVWLVAEY